MKTREIPKSNWLRFFAQISDVLQGKVIQIEVDSLDLGAQIAVNKLSLNSLAYDRKDDSFIISTDEIQHVIQIPQQLFVTEEPLGIVSLQVRSSDEIEQIIRFSEPLAFPQRVKPRPM